MLTLNKLGKFKNLPDDVSEDPGPGTTITG